MNPDPLAAPNSEAVLETAPPVGAPSDEAPVLDESVGEVPLALQVPPSSQVGPLSDMGLEAVAASVPALPETPQPENLALALQFSPVPEGAFNTSLTLSLICTSPRAEIRYALGAADVGEEGVLFNNQDKIFLTQTTSVVARAFEDGQRGPLLSGNFEIRKAQWKELEPAEQSDPTPHKVAEVLGSPDGWQSAAASVRGKLHAHRALWREDSFGLANIEAPGSSWSVVVVSDGAGSAALSRVGSRLACAAAIESLRGSLGDIGQLAEEQEALLAEDLPRLREALVGCGVAALDAIRGEAQMRQHPVSVFAATLLVFVRRAWNGSQLCSALQVGDGSIALWDDHGLTLLGEADHGQHSSETRFLTTNGVEGELASRVKFSIKPQLRAFAVMSDGVSDDYFPEEKRLGEVIEAVLPLVQSEGDAGAALLGWLGYEKKGSSDDRTLVVGWPREETLPLPEREATHGAVETADSDA